MSRLRDLHVIPSGAFADILRHAGALFAIVPALAMILAAGAGADVFITEVADPNNDANARFVELYNSGPAAVDLNGWRIRRYSNGGLTPTNIPLATTTTLLAPGTFFIAANTTTFNSLFAPVTANLIDPNVNGNGNDWYHLYNGSTLVDAFGTIGDSAAIYENGRAERKAAVASARTVFDINDWNINSLQLGAGPQDAPGGFDPSAWIGAGGPAPLANPNDVIFNEFWIGDDGATAYPSIGGRGIRGSWAELLVVNGPQDLRGWTVTDKDTPVTTAEGSLTFASAGAAGLALSAMAPGSILLLIFDGAANPAISENFDPTLGPIILKGGPASNGFALTMTGSFNLDAFNDNLVLVAGPLTTGTAVDFISEFQTPDPAWKIAFTNPFVGLGNNSGAYFKNSANFGYNNDNGQDTVTSPTGWAVESGGSHTSLTPGRLNRNQAPLGYAAAVLPMRESFIDVPNSDLTSGGAYVVANARCYSNPIQVLSGSLNHLGLRVPHGNRVRLQAFNGQDLRRNFTPVSAGDLFASFVLRVPAAPTGNNGTGAGAPLFAFNRLTVADQQVEQGRVLIRRGSAPGAYQLGLALDTNDEGVADWTGDIAQNAVTTRFIIIRYAINAAGDSIALYVDPTPGGASIGAGATMSVIHLNSGGEANLDSISGETLDGFILEQSNNATNWTAEMDEVRVGQNYSEINPGLIPDELFISEYVEGSGENKAIEIYNGTNAPVDMAAGAYELWEFPDGAPDPGARKLTLNATIPSNGVYVIVRDSVSTSQTLKDKANLLTASPVMAFDGNDVVALVKNGVLIDVIGRIGENPGVEWGSGAVTTLDHTLVRKPTINEGDSDGYDAFDPSVEWIGYPMDDFTHLGGHVFTLPDEPNIQVSPSSLDFETIRPLSAKTLTLTITNNGLATSLTVFTSTTITGPDAGDFSIVGPPRPFTLLYGGGAALMAIRFNPGAAEKVSNAVLEICSNDPGDPVTTIPLQGVSARQPALMITEIMYDPSSQTPDWQWVEIYNTAAGPIDLGGFVFDHESGLPLLSSNITTSTIAPGGTAILFDADDLTSGQFMAAWGSEINLIGVTNWPVLQGAGDRIGLWDNFTSYAGQNFANAMDAVPFGASAPWPAPNQAASIYLRNLSYGNDFGDHWALSAPGAVTPLGTAYRSIALGGNSGADVGSPLTPSSDDPNIITPGGVDFGAIAAGTLLDKGLLITNTGPSAPLLVTSASIGGADADKFAIVGPLPLLIPPGNRTATLTIRFAPGAVLGSFNASLAIFSNDAGGSTPTVALAGQSVRGLPVYEPFDYTTGSLNVIAGYEAYSDPGVWPPQVTSDSLAAGVTLPLPVSQGNKLEMQGVSPGEDLRSQFTPAIASGAVYASMLLRVTNNPTDNTNSAQVFAFNRRLTNGQSREQGALRITSADASNTRYKLGVTLTANQFAYFSGMAIDLVPGQTYFIIMKYGIAASAGHDMMRLWVNPLPGGLEDDGTAADAVTHSWVAGVENEVSAGSALNGFNLIQSGFAGAHITELDEIRIGTSYSQVAPGLPSVRSITRLNLNPTSATLVEYLVRFSEPVDNVTPDDFALTAPDLPGASVVSAVAGATTDVYTVTVNTGAGEGTIRLDLNAGTDIRTASGQAIANTPFLVGEAYTIDRTPPVLLTDSLITSASSPIITGTVTDTSSSIAAVQVEVNGVLYSATVAGGVWSALIVGPLGQGIYDITAIAYDAAGNVGYDYSGLLLVDQTPPTVTVNALLTSQPQPTLTGTFIDTGGTGISAINVTVDGETAPAALGANTWSVVVPHALSDGVYDVQVAATDLVGNVGHDLTTNELRVDLTSPVVISVAPSAGIELFQLTTITVVFSEPVAGVAAANLTIQDVSTTATTPSLGVSTADGIAYQFIVPQPADGPVTLTLTGAGAILDQVGMPFDSFVWTYTMNSNALFVTLSSPSDTFTSGPFLVIATFSHDVADFDATDILTTNASISAFTSSSAQVYQWLATPNFSRLVQMQITTGVAHGASGQPNRPSNVLDRIFDGRAPFIVSLSPPRNSIVTTTDLAVIAVTFSESVSGVAPEDLIVNGSAATAVFGSGPGPYLFSGFAPPATVDVTVQALGGTTLDQVGNAFEGDSWSYIIDVGSSAVREWMRY